MAVQRETGGNLAETLENLSDIIRKRHQMQQKVRAMASEARASAWIVGALPVLLFGALMVLNPDYARSEEHTSELPSLMRISYAVFCLKKKTNTTHTNTTNTLAVHVRNQSK